MTITIKKSLFKFFGVMVAGFLLACPANAVNPAASEKMDREIARKKLEQLGENIRIYQTRKVWPGGNEYSGCYTWDHRNEFLRKGGAADCVENAKQDSVFIDGAAVLRYFNKQERFSFYRKWEKPVYPTWGMIGEISDRGTTDAGYITQREIADALVNLVKDMYLHPEKYEDKTISIGSGDKIHGLCYGPFRNNEDPDKGIYPTLNELKEDLSFIAKMTDRIRTYGNSGTLSEIPHLCQNYGLDCYVGAWLGDQQIENEKEINGLIEAANTNKKNIKGLIVGNEVLLRNDLTLTQLIGYLKRVKQETEIPIGIAEVWTVLLKYRQISDYIDFILIHIHPYWEGIQVETAAEYVAEKYKVLKQAFPDKKIIIGETGWPSSGQNIGKAYPGKKNQRMFFENIYRLAKDNDIPYFFFEIFNEEWKNKFEGRVGAHWGIFNADGSIKSLLSEMFSDELRDGIERPARIADETEIEVPLIVFSEAGSSENRFKPTGYMGDTKSITLERDCDAAPFSGQTCVKITYNPTDFSSWAGVYWQYPINNWGEYPGYQIKNAKKLVFWAKGKNGREKAEFKIGGINRSPHHHRTIPYQDSFGPLTTGIIKLSKKWKKYVIKLNGSDLTNLIGGFCWVTNRRYNPKGSVIYLDEIKIL